MKLKGRPARWLTALGYRLLQIWARTLRFEIDDRSGLTGRPATHAVITAIWHNRLLFWAYTIRRYLPQYIGTALVSASGDGRIIGDLVARHGFGIVHGSSSRQGASALLRLQAVLAPGHIVGLIPDGPRGPAYRLAPGIVYLAQKSGAPILPMNMEFARCWRLKSWDRFMLPKPFSTVRLIFGPLHRVASTASEEEFENERRRLENAMMDLVETR